jgi:molecular chaperone HtpG
MSAARSRQAPPPARHVADDQATLDELLATQPDAPVFLPFTPEDIGGELVAILSKGLYTDPRAAIREYVQNAVDGGSKRVLIKITGNSLTITDDGAGMALAQLIAARQFGLSTKVYAENVGFRGIGVYSGFDLCRRARIHSKPRAATRANVLVFDFEAMRQRLDEARVSRATSGQPTLIELISEHTWFTRDDGEYDAETQFTHVDLQDLSPEHIRRLSSTTEMREYLLQTLPIDFDADFEYRDRINEKLLQNVPGYHPIVVELEIEDHPKTVVLKDAIDGLEPPEFGYATVNQRQVAYWWAARNKTPGRVLSRAEKLAKSKARSQYAGFVYKMKGFTIGDRSTLRSMFQVQDHLYYWYTGEIYVLDENVVPNAERDAFETNPASEQLRIAVADVMLRLLKDVQKFQEVARANEKLGELRGRLEALREAVAAGSVDAGQVVVDVNEIDLEVKEHRKKLRGAGRAEADALIKEAEQLERSVRKDARAAVQGALAIVPPMPAPDEGEPNDVPPADATPAETPSQAASLSDLLLELNWDTSGEVGRLAEAIERALARVLGSDSALYRRVLEELRDRLSTPRDR